jgi:hypothetical protein
MDIYHVWADLKQGVKDTEFTNSVNSFLTKLKDDDHLQSFRITRRKLGFGIPELPEFHITIEFHSLEQFDKCFKNVATRTEPMESFHYAVNSKVSNFKAALYRDFPDEVRKSGEEKF